MTSFEPTSLCAILPSGEALDFVSPGMSRVVAARGREGVDEPLSWRLGGLIAVSFGAELWAYE